jgi:hypothetical protein
MVQERMHFGRLVAADSLNAKGLAGFTELCWLALIVEHLKSAVSSFVRVASTSIFDLLNPACSYTSSLFFEVEPRCIRSEATWKTKFIRRHSAD